MHTRTRRLGGFAAVMLAALALAGSAHAELSNIPSSPLVTDGSVGAFAKSGNTLFIGGSFDRIGLRTGAFVSTSSSTGAVEPGLPQVSGINEPEVNAIVPDGSGGWYIGGTFSHVGSSARASLAHVLANGTVDPSFHPDPDGSVNALVLSGTTLYVGGFFANIGGAAHSNLAAVSTTTGTATSLDVDADSDVSAMALSGTTLYVGGDFGTIGHNDAARAHLAAIDTTTGDAGGWNPNPTSPSFTGITALALSPSGSTVYVAGSFDHIGANNLARTDLAAINGDTTGNATGWDPNPVNALGDPDLESLAVSPSGNTVYAGGAFTQIGTNDAARNGLAALDASSAAASGWNPNPTAPGGGGVDTILLDGSTLYVTGFFDAIGQSTRVARRNAAAVDISSGDANGWDPDPDRGSILSIAAAGSHVAIGGQFDSFHGAARSGLAAVNLATGELLPWDPHVAFNDGAPGSVNALAVSGNTLYAGGLFDKIGLCAPQSTANLAAIDATTGIATPWAPAPNDLVTSLAVSGGTVYAGGNFSRLGANGLVRDNLGAVDATTGNATAFNPSASAFVQTLAIANSKLYAGGGFTTIAGQGRNHAASFDLATGNLNSWDPDTGDFVNAIAPDGSDLYLGGPFTTVSGDAHHGVARVDGVNGDPDGWAPDADAVDTVAVLDGLVYIGGQFTQVNSTNRGNLADLDPTTATLGSWDPNTGNNTVNALLPLGPGQLAVGGGFDTDLAPNRDLALFGVPAASSLPAANVCPTGPGGPGAPGGGTPVPPAGKKPAVSLRISRTQHVVRQRGLILSALSDHDGTLTFSATVSLPKGAKVVRFKAATKTVKAGKRVKVKLKLSKRNLDLIKRALRRHKPNRLFAKVRVNVRDTAKLSSSKAVKVRLLR